MFQSYVSKWTITNLDCLDFSYFWQNHFKEGATGEKSKKDKKDKDKNQPESPELITQKKFEKNYIRASREVLKNELAASKPPARDLKYSIWNIGWKHFDFGNTINLGTR